MTKVMSGRAQAWQEFDRYFTVRVRFDDPRYVVVMSGELDLASRSAAARACTSTDHVDVVADMADLAFMDCAGYGALVAARAVLERRGGSLTLMGAVGEPLRLLSRIEQVEQTVS